MRLDPECKLLPTDCYMEICASAVRQSQHLTERHEPQTLEAEVLNDDEGFPSSS